MPSHPFQGEIIHEIQSKLSLVQPEAFYLCPIISYLRKEQDALLTASSFYVAGEAASPQAPFLQPK